MVKPKAMAGEGYFDAATFDAFTDADIERSIAEDPDLAPPTEILTPLLEPRQVRRKLGLTQHQLAKKLGVSVARLREWENNPAPIDPALQALLRILDRVPATALSALDEPQRKVG